MSDIPEFHGNPNDLNYNPEYVLELKAKIDKLQKAANLPSSYRVAKSAMKYFDSEFMGQEPKQLWSWAIEEALTELSNDS